MLIKCTTVLRLTISWQWRKHADALFSFCDFTSCIRVRTAFCKLACYVTARWWRTEYRAQLGLALEGQQKSVVCKFTCIGLLCATVWQHFLAHFKWDTHISSYRLQESIQNIYCYQNWSNRWIKPQSHWSLYIQTPICNCSHSSWHHSSKYSLFSLTLCSECLYTRVRWS